MPLFWQINWQIFFSGLACHIQSPKFNKSSSDNQRDTNIPVELELSAKDQESTSASVTRQRGNGVNEKDYAPTSGSIQGVPHSNVNTEAMSSKTGKVEQSIERKTASISDFTPETWMIPETVDGELSQLNLAIVSI